MNFIIYVNHIISDDEEKYVLNGKQIHMQIS